MSRYQLRRTGEFSTPGGANVIQLDQDVVKFGRNPEQVQIVLHSTHYSNMISREHAEIRRQRNQDSTTAFFLVDRSLNGTYVNDLRVRGNTLLHPGDVIKFGHINGAAIQPGMHAPQANAEFAYIFEKVPRNNNSANLPPSMASLQPQHPSQASQQSCTQSATGYPFASGSGGHAGASGAAAGQYSQTFAQNPYGSHPMAQQQARLAAAGYPAAYQAAAASAHTAFGGFNPYHAAAGAFLHPAYAALYGQQRASGMASFPTAASNLQQNLNPWAGTHPAYSGLAANPSVSTQPGTSSASVANFQQSQMRNSAAQSSPYVSAAVTNSTCAVGTGSAARDAWMRNAVAGQSGLVPMAPVTASVTSIGNSVSANLPTKNTLMNPSSGSMASAAANLDLFALEHFMKQPVGSHDSSFGPRASLLDSSGGSSTSTSGLQPKPDPLALLSPSEKHYAGREGRSSGGVIINVPGTSGSAADLAASVIADSLLKSTTEINKRVAECDSSVPSPPKVNVGGTPTPVTKTATDEDENLSQQLRELAANATNRFAYNSSDSPQNLFGNSPEPEKKPEIKEEESQAEPDVDDSENKSVKADEEENRSPSPVEEENRSPSPVEEEVKETRSSRPKKRTLSPDSQRRLAATIDWKPRRKSNEVARLLNDLTEGSFHHQAARHTKQMKKQLKKKQKKKTKRSSLSPASSRSLKSPAKEDTEQRSTPSPSNSSTSASSTEEDSPSRPSSGNRLASPASDLGAALSPDSRDKDKCSPLKKRKGFRSPIGPSSPAGANASGGSGSISGGERDSEVTESPKKRLRKSSTSSRRTASSSASPSRSPRRPLPSTIDPTDSSTETKKPPSGKKGGKKNSKLKIALRGSTTGKTGRRGRPSNSSAPPVSHKKRLTGLPPKKAVTRTLQADLASPTESSARELPKRGRGRGRKRKNPEPESEDPASPPGLLGLDKTIDHWHFHDPGQSCDAKKKCKKPQSDNVDWIQCDGCGGWFHMMCTGTEIDAEDEDAVFNCRVCTS